MKNTYLVCAAALLLFGCGDGKSDAAKGMAEVADSAAMAPAMDLAAYDLPMLLDPPQQLGNDSVVVAWNEEFGHVSITAGDHFGMIVTEEPGDIGRMKGDLDRDLLRKNTIVEETPEMLIYRSSYPDDADLVFVHFYRVVQAGDRLFVVESDPMGRFNEADVRAMVKSLSVKRPA